MAILNTNLLKIEDHDIDFGEQGIYHIPGEIPIGLYLRLMERSQIEDPTGQFKEGIEVLYEIFLIRQPDLTRDKYDSLITINIFSAIINLIFADMTAEETLERLQEAKEEAKESVKDGKKKPEQVES